MQRTKGYNNTIRKIYRLALLLVTVLSATFGGCAKDSSIEDAGDKFLLGIAKGDTSLLRSVSSQKLLSTIAHEGWPMEVTTPKKNVNVTTWEATNTQIQGDTVAYIKYVLKNSTGGNEATANCKLRLVHERSGWKVEDLTPTQ